MELYDKLNLLEEKLDKVVEELAQARSEKDRMQAIHDDMATRFGALEAELEQARRDRDAVRSKIENILNKLG